jgi:hypothetical protein
MRPPDVTPLVAVVYDIGAASPVEILRAAEGRCDVLFLFDRRDEGAREAGELFDEFDVGCDITGLPFDAVVQRLGERAVAGVVTFSEFQLTRTARLAAALGKPFHTPAVVDRLTHKSLQRTALSAAGVDPLRFRKVESVADVPAALLDVGLPCVVKPDVSSASRNTFQIDSLAGWQAVAPRYRQDEALIVEELLVGDPSVAGSAWGDYVSVDVVTMAGVHTRFATVGKFRLVPPFREGGMFHPSTLGPAQLAAVQRLAFAALDALGVEHGITHTEIKLTAGGPRLIEVNGRLGGYVADLVRRSVGVDPVALALHAALGTEPPTVAAPGEPALAYQLFLPSPARPVRVREVRNVALLEGLAGVESVQIRVRPGDLLDPGEGTGTYLGVVRGAVADHGALLDLAVRAGNVSCAEYDVVR